MTQRREWQLDWGGAEREFRRVLDVEPNTADAHGRYGTFLASHGRFPEARVHVARAVELSPLEPTTHAQHGVVSNFSGRFEEATTHYRAAVRLAPDNTIGHWGLWTVFHYQRMFDDAQREAKDYFRAAGDSVVVAALESGYLVGGYPAALRRAAEVLSDRAGARHVRPTWLFTLYARTGETERVLDWLEKAVEDRDPSVRNVMVHQDTGHMRSHPRFQAILRRMHLP